jgi:hypothetical protein
VNVRVIRSRWVSTIPVTAVETPLAALPSALTARLPALLDEVEAVLAVEWADYAQFLVENRAAVAASADATLHRIVTTAMAGSDPVPDDGELFEEIGRTRCREGHDLSRLLGAFQAGAQVCWRHLGALAVGCGVSPTELAALGEAVFALVDRLSSAFARGYVLEQAESGAVREQLRSELAELLLSDRADRAAVRATAARAEWPVPDRLAVVLLRCDEAGARRTAARLDAAHLVVARPAWSGLVLADPSGPGVRRRLEAALRGSGAVVGMPGPAEHLPASLPVAEIAARLQREGVLGDDPVFVEEHLDTIIVHRDALLLQSLREQVLRSLDGVTPAARVRLCETLAAWLRHQGDRRAVAAELHIHPQTVRYRLARLHELFGSQLGDPSTRARMTLALAWAPDRAG